MRHVFAEDPGGAAGKPGSASISSQYALDFTKRVADVHDVGQRYRIENRDIIASRRKPALISSSAQEVLEHLEDPRRSFGRYATWFVRAATAISPRQSTPPYRPIYLYRTPNEVRRQIEGAAGRFSTNRSSSTTGQTLELRPTFRFLVRNSDESRSITRRPESAGLQRSVRGAAVRIVPSAIGCFRPKFSEFEGFRAFSTSRYSPPRSPRKSVGADGVVGGYTPVLVASALRASLLLTELRGVHEADYAASTVECCPTTVRR